MAIRKNSKLGFYATGHQDSKIFAVQVPNGGVAYLDVPEGEYDAWAPGAAAGEHFRWCYLVAPDGAAAPTLLAANFPAPTAAAANQAQSLPANAQGAAWAPATASPLRIAVIPGFRVAVLYSAAAQVQLNLCKVL